MIINKNNKVVVAMSGGVDSSLTAALLMEAGYEVIGVHMRLHHLHAQSRATNASGRLNKGCCSADDVDDARMVCYELGIPFYVLDFEGDFRKTVIQNFVDEYSAGRTPYPCLMCNRYVKFDSLLKRAAQLGADQSFHLSVVFGPQLAAAVILVDDGRADVAGHDHNRVLEIDRPPLPVRQPAIIEHLQQNVENVVVRLFDFIEQHHTVRAPADCFAELPAFFVADVAGRRANQPRHGVFLHVLAHVDPHHRIFVIE